MSKTVSYDPLFHHRRSIRLKGHDYTQAGAYFVTLCTWNRECLFGEVVDGEMRLSEWGRIAAQEWERTSDVRPGVQLDAYVVMPNHIHGIIVIGPPATPVGATRRVAPTDTQNAENNPTGATRRGDPTGTQNAENNPTGATRPADPRGPHPGSLGAIIGQYKSLVAKQINRVRDTPGAPIWQRGYYEHIIRGEKELERIRAYIAGNPARWAHDREA